MIELGQRPERPSSKDPYQMSDELWGIVEACWSELPEDRPTASQLVEMMDRIV